MSHRLIEYSSSYTTCAVYFVDIHEILQNVRNRNDKGRENSEKFIFTEEMIAYQKITESTQENRASSVTNAPLKPKLKVPVIFIMKITPTDMEATISKLTTKVIIFLSAALPLVKPIRVALSISYDTNPYNFS